MATRLPLSQGRMEVALQSVPLDVRIAEAEAMIKVGRLAGIAAIEILLAARSPKPDERGREVSIEVPDWKVEKVMRGKRIVGSLKQLGIGV